MSKKVHVCGDKDLHIAECSECDDYDSRITKLEECCEDVNEALDGKQDTLVSGVNIKTINHQTLLGDGNIDIEGGGGGDSVSYMQTQTTGDELGVITINGNAQKIYGVDYSSKQDQLVSGTNIKTINGETVLGSGNIVTPDTDTHYLGYIRAGASGGTSNAATSDPYLNYVEDGSNRSGVRLIGGSNVTISSDSSGNVTINSSGGGGSGDAVSYTQTLTSGNECGTITINGVSKKIYSPTLKTINGTSIVGSGDIVTPDTDTHYTGYIRAGSSTGTSNAAVSNPYLNYVENSTRRSGVRLVGGDNVSIASDANGNVTIDATDTDTHYLGYVRAGSSTSTSNASATNPYINYVENGTRRSGVRLYGGTNVSVSSDSSGTITISASGGGDTVSYSQSQTSGDTLGTITINGSSKNIYGQSKLVSGTNVKTINGQSILGSGNLPLLMRTSTDTGSVSISPHADMQVDIAPYHPSGYTRVGIVGWDSENAVSSGGATYCTVRSIHPTGSENIRVELSNYHDTKTIKVIVTIWILWVYGTLY